MSLLYLYFYWW